MIDDLFTTGGFFGLLNYLIVFLQALYVLYAFLITRQVALLNQTFKTEPAWLFTFISLAHLFIAIALVLISILSL